MKKQIPWSQHIDAWRTSGLTQAQYCRQHGLAAKSFSFWLRRRRAEESAPPSVDLIPVQIAATEKLSNSVSAFTVNYQGVEIQLSTDVSPRWLAELLQCLA
jgi:hypothetical protein